jgi:adenine-specific DNA-methyltransferase
MSQKLTTFNQKELLGEINAFSLRSVSKIAYNQKSELGQFMTPTKVARFMASLLSFPSLKPIKLLDAGAGLGCLSIAFLEKWLSDSKCPPLASLVAYEVDSSFRTDLERHLIECANLVMSSGRELDIDIIEKDFILEAVNHIRGEGTPIFTHAILNPPYRKIHSQSNHRLLLRTVGVETVNLYTAFVALSLELLEKGGELVAILPRSFCNGLYY